jgi:putative transposase
MSRPREVLPGYYFITRRCTQRQFLLRPDAETNNAFIYCLALAAKKYDIDLILAVAESNHHHTVIYDRHGHYPKFMEHFHKLVARSQNSLRGRWENFWASQQACVVRLVDRADVIAKLVYTASNPVKDRLVERAHQWPGVNGYSKLLRGRSLKATRPRHFFRKNGSMPESVELDLVLPADLGAPEEVRRELREGVTAVEEAVAAERRKTNARIVGRRAILETCWTASPDSQEPRRNLRPQFAARDRESRIAALLHYREFLHLYRSARQRWLVGLAAVFPVGTYWLHHFANVKVASAPV